MTTGIAPDQAQIVAGSLPNGSPNLLPERCLFPESVCAVQSGKRYGSRQYVRRRRGRAG